ncbi:protein-disulfide reductase DsbD family protein [Candidatus Symbiobacter mobilis]|uniref:Thiol:disulfide interchange protein n=1 Tax=Candidatus Symbiobacter mobilis CR TaxID=946483 RepID=U5N7N7_9BURK|nr:protein-disulfide reductase DsbD domain-containing protein [Candidatus Symbiobacter mobilis]AGX87377.1 thiol:disulfide interchange protein [Candidatus Symbiobacter mobilis CR]
MHSLFALHGYRSAVLRWALGALLWAWGLCAWASFALRGPVYETPQVRAELLLHAPDGVTPGKTVWAGLRLQHQPGWHTYWRNPGDAGLPTALQWTIPAGVEAGDIVWPLPERFLTGELVNYGYEGAVLLLVPLRVAEGFVAPAAEWELRVHASWLACRNECLPQEGDVLLRVPAQGAVVHDAAAFAHALRQQPVQRDVKKDEQHPVLQDAIREASQEAHQEAPREAQAMMQAEGAHLNMAIRGLPQAWRWQEIDAFVEPPGVLEATAQTQRWQGEVWRSRWVRTAGAALPQTLPVLLVAQVEGQRIGIRVAARSGALPVDALRTATTQSSSMGVGIALLFAWLGGILLNLMPCVFPVLAIKVMQFAGNDKPLRERVTASLLYTVGVVATVLALGAAVLALRGVGTTLGWGFQLQSPAVVAALAALFTAIGLHLAGVFAFGAVSIGAAGPPRQRSRYAQALASGVLVVVVASPCTAPFLGASLGLAWTLPTMPALAIFLALGVGIALPFLILGILPGWTRYLPRSGTWMQTFRSAMAFPMFATVVWLLWVFGKQQGVDAAAWLLAGLLALAWLLWCTGRRRKGWWVGVSMAVFAVLAAVGGGWKQAVFSSSASADARTVVWEEWAPSRVEERLAQGQPVLVEFTAAWCVICQRNARVLQDPAVVAAMAGGKVAALRADWTRRDPAIAEALARLGRSGVPVHVLYVPGREPLLLPEWLTVDNVRAALATAPRGGGSS